MGSMRTGFITNLRSYLNTARILNAFSAKRVSRTTASVFTSDIDSIATAVTAIDPVDADKNKRGYPHTLLAGDVLDNLIQIQNELATAPAQESAGASGKVARAYQQAQDRFIEDEAVTFHFGN